MTAARLSASRGEGASARAGAQSAVIRSVIAKSL